MHKEENVLLLMFATVNLVSPGVDIYRLFLSSTHYMLNTTWTFICQVQKPIVSIIILHKG